MHYYTLFFSFILGSSCMTRGLMILYNNCYTTLSIIRTWYFFLSAIITLLTIIYLFANIPMYYLQTIKKKNSPQIVYWIRRCNIINNSKYFIIAKKNNIKTSKANAITFAIQKANKRGSYPNEGKYRQKKVVFIHFRQQNLRPRKQI